jgi:hypothetical protein
MARAALIYSAAAQLKMNGKFDLCPEHFNLLFAAPSELAQTLTGQISL